jgi:hypothetical protein
MDSTSSPSGESSSLETNVPSPPSSVSSQGQSVGSSLGSTAGQAATARVRIKPGFREELQAMLQGLASSLPANASISTVDGLLSQPALVAEVQQVLALFAALDAREQELKAARQQVKAALPAAYAMLGNLKTCVTAFFHHGSPVLAQFGVTTKKAPTKRGTQALAAQAVKARETRKLRGTVGPKKKLATKFVGQVAPAAVQIADAAVPLASSAVRHRDETTADVTSSTPGAPFAPSG